MKENSIFSTLQLSIDKWFLKLLLRFFSLFICIKCHQIHIIAGPQTAIKMYRFLVAKLLSVYLIHKRQSDKMTFLIDRVERLFNYIVIKFRWNLDFVCFTNNETTTKIATMLVFGRRFNYGTKEEWWHRDAQLLELALSPSIENVFSHSC